MSAGEVDPNYPPHLASGLPPSPTIENPAGVFPSNDPDKATPPIRNGRSPHVTHYMGNPFLMHDAFRKLDSTLGEVIAILEDEEVPQGEGAEPENPLLRKFRSWRDDLDTIRGNTSRTPSSGPRTTQGSPEREGGMFLD